MPSPRHLWAGSWREESERNEAPRAEQTPDTSADAEPTTQTTPNEAPSTPRMGAISRRTAVAGTVAGLIIGGGTYALVQGSNDNNQSPTAQALPAVSSKPLTPRKGQTRAGAIYAQASPAVVSIRTGVGSGTGFLVDNASTVVTNAHVVEGASTVTVRFGSEGRDIRANVLGSDPSSDLAVLHLPSGSAPSGVKPLALADSTQVRVGDDVIAIGNPFGLDRTATEGIVSGLGRSIQAPNGFQIDDAIQTDAPINPGNSGGPLLDDAGRVVGVNSQIETGGTSNGNLGIGFAVPSNTVRSVVPLLERGEHIKRPWLGVATEATPNASGARIGQVTSGGPAEGAGLQPGDIITAVGDTTVTDPSDVAKVVGAGTPGRSIDVHVQRGGSAKTVKVTLGTRPAQAP